MVGLVGRYVGRCFKHIDDVRKRVRVQRTGDRVHGSLIPALYTHVGNISCSHAASVSSRSTVRLFQNMDGGRLLHDLGGWKGLVDVDDRAPVLLLHLRFVHLHAKREGCGCSLQIVPR